MTLKTQRRKWFLFFVEQYTAWKTAQAANCHERAAAMVQSQRSNTGSLDAWLADVANCLPENKTRRGMILSIYCGGTGMDQTEMKKAGSYCRDFWRLVECKGLYSQGLAMMKGES